MWNQIVENLASTQLKLDSQPVQWKINLITLWIVLFHSGDDENYSSASEFLNFSLIICICRINLLRNFASSQLLNVLYYKKEWKNWWLYWWNLSNFASYDIVWLGCTLILWGRFIHGYVETSTAPISPGLPCPVVKALVAMLRFLFVLTNHFVLLLCCLVFICDIVGCMIFCRKYRDECCTPRGYKV